MIEASAQNLYGSCFNSCNRPPGKRQPELCQYFPMYEFSYYHRNKLTYAEHYNFSIQRQLSASTVLTIAYVGTQSHHVLATLHPLEGSG